MSEPTPESPDVQPLTEDINSFKDYNIKRWDAVMFGNSNIITPFISFVPDLKLVEFFENNNNVVEVYISNSNSSYDGQFIPAVISRRCDITGSCMPNYSSRAPYFAANLYSKWLGYPSENGIVKFAGFTGA